MLRRVNLNRMDAFGLLAVCVTTFLFLGAAINAAGPYMSHRHISATDFIIGCLGWCISTFGPIVLAIAFWRLVKKVARVWLLHLLMFPLSLTTFAVGSRIMLSVLGASDFDDTLGGPIIQAIVLLLLAVTGYYSAVLYTVFAQKPASTSGS